MCICSRCREAEGPKPEMLNYADLREGDASPEPGKEKPRVEMNWLMESIASTPRVSINKTKIVWILCFTLYIY